MEEHTPQTEIGSYFHWIDQNEYDQLVKDYPTQFNENYKVFYSGRHALKYLLTVIENQKHIHRIWVPKYYCQHVVNWMKKNYSNLDFFEVQPFEFDNGFRIPDEVGQNDVIIINNYWGLTTTNIVDKKRNGPIVIEDHSHGWLTKQSSNSNADFCFVSLRKSLPIPLGGICWKPGGSLVAIDLPESQELYHTWDLMVEAMQSKRDYLKGVNDIDKSIYLQQISEVENSLDTSLDIIKMRDEDELLIRNYMRLNILSIKDKNLSYLLERLSNTDLFRIIERPNHIPFGLMLLVKNEFIYASFKDYLVQNKVYPSNLWPNNERWNSFLNIHVDFRYDFNDIEHISEIINNWTSTYINN